MTLRMRPVTQTPGNKLALDTWPHLREGEIAEGYSLAFASEMTEAGSTPTHPMVVWDHPPDAEDEYDWREVSPSKWDGISEVRHQGNIVYRPTVQREVAPPPRTEVFRQEFDTMQDEMQLAQLEAFMEKEQSRTRRKNLIFYGSIGGGLILIIIIVLYFVNR